MAEAVIVAIAGEIIASPVPQAMEKIGKLWGVKRELEVLRHVVSTLQIVLEYAEKQYHQNHQIQDWLDRMKDALYDAQDLLEEFNIEAMRRELRGHNEVMKEVRTFFSSSNRLAFNLKMSSRLRAVRERIEAINACRRFHFIPPVDSLVEREQRKREETHSFIREGDVRGRDDDKERITKFLLDPNMHEDVSILPIVGIGGLGKTALAKFVYNDEMVSKHFDLKMWVCVSNDFDVKKIVTNIIACVKSNLHNEVKGNLHNEVAMEQLQSELRAKIDGKRYFLVLDDLWNEEPKKWLSLKELLMEGARGSKILITTRLPLVAEITGTGSPYFLRDLSESASVDLLMQMACRQEERQDLEMLAIAKEIARKCSGVPLVVRTVGYLLSSKKTKCEWLRFKDDELPKVSKSEDSIKSVLKLSYDHLPSHLKQCFALCSLFPKDYEIEKQTLVDLWMAEGFIQPSNRSQHLEDIAHGYFEDLLWSNFFQDVKEDPYRKEICKMHDLMHDLACLVAGKGCWVARDDTELINERTRHISYGSTFNLLGALPILRLKASALRTILSTGIEQEEWQQIRQREPTSEADLLKLIQSFKRLRILDLNCKMVEKVPRSIYKLKHLTYLDLSFNIKLKRLPNSITRLQSLQTLNLSYCHALEELPSDIRKLVSLRNLDIRGCSELSYLPCGIGEISSLHRLTNFILPEEKARAKNYCGLGELKALNNIRGKLSIENLGYVTNAEVECKDENLMGKHFLKSLTLSWGNFNTDDAITNEVLDGLKPPSNLQELTIQYYKGESFPRWMMDNLIFFLPHLVELWFIHCRRCKCLPPLGQLPRLKSLHIIGLPQLEYIESGQSSPSTTSFPSLLKLKIHNCEKLKAMPITPHLEELNLTEANGALLINQMMLGLNKLKRLDVKRTKFLECLPEEGFQSLTSLEYLSIEGCHQLTSLSQGMRHLSKLVDLNILFCNELDLSKDESGNIILDFHGLQSLRSLKIKQNPKLESLPQWILQLRSLEHLEIIYCPNFKELSEQIEKCEELDISKDKSGNILDFHGGLQSLRFVYVFSLPKLTSLPQWLLQARNLEHLRICFCRNLKDIPQQIEALQSLQNLAIAGCSSLTSFPEAMRRLTSLTHLSIFECGELEESCKRQAGEDWDKIAHIPNILYDNFLH